MNLFRLFLYGSFLAAFSAVINAQQNTGPLKLSLKQAQEYALQNNQSILNANLDVESAKKKVWETTAIGLPQASGKLSFSYMPTLPSSIEQFSQFDLLFGWMYNVDQYVHEQVPADPNFGGIPAPQPQGSFNPNDMKWNLPATVTISQLIFSGSYLVGLQSARVYKSLSELNQVKSRQDVLQSVTNSYFNVLIARENRSILDSTYTNLTKTFSQMQAMAGQGFIEETDLDQMKITVSSVKTSLDMITRMEDISSRMLKLQLGVDLDTPLELTDDMKQLVDALTIDQLLTTDFILEDNVSYQLLESQEKANYLLLKLRKSEFLPDIAGFYQYQKEFNTNAFTFNPPHMLGVTMNIPIFSSGQRIARISQAKIDLDKTRNTKDQLSNSLKLDFYNSRSALLTARDNFKTKSVNLQLSKKIYERALIKYTNGMISSIDLNQVQNQYLTAQSDYYSSLQELISTKNKLEQLLTKI